jgi:hypothetical protein
MDTDTEKLRQLTENLFQSWKTEADKLNVDHTKTIYIEPVLKCLGWDPVDDMTRREPNSVCSKTPDYILHANNINYLVIEAKPLQHRLDLKDAEQAEEYGLHANTNWCLATEGYFYKVYNRNWDMQPKERLFFKTSLTEATENFSRFLYKLNLISKKSMASGNIDELAKTFYRRKKIQTLLTNPPGELIQFIESLGAYKHLGKEAIKDSLRELKYNEFNTNTCPLCNTRETCELDFSQRLEEHGISRDQFVFLPFISIERFVSFDDWQDHMHEKHPEVFDPLY